MDCGWVAADRGSRHACQTVASKIIVTDEACSGVHVFWTPSDVSRNDMDGTTLKDGNTPIRSPRFTSPVLIGGGTTISPTRTGSQEIIRPKGPTGYVEVRNTEMFNTPMNGILWRRGILRLIPVM